MWIKLFRGIATSPGIVQQRGVLNSTEIKEKTNRATFPMVSSWFPLLFRKVVVYSIYFILNFLYYKY